MHDKGRDFYKAATEAFGILPCRRDLNGPTRKPRKAVHHVTKSLGEGSFCPARSAAKSLQCSKALSHDRAWWRVSYSGVRVEVGVGVPRHTVKLR